MNEQNKIAIEIKTLDNMISRKIFEKCKQDHEKIMSHVQACIIKFLHENKNIVYQSDIEKMINVRRSTMSGILDTMEKNGYIIRTDSKTDARKKEILLTKKSLDRYHIMRSKVDSFEKIMSNGISNDELETFFEVVSKIKNNLRKDDNND